MNYNGIKFNDAWVKTKTEAEFIAHESHHGLSEKQLKEAYGLMVPKKKAVEKPDEVIAKGNVKAEIEDAKLDK